MSKASEWAAARQHVDGERPHIELYEEPKLVPRPGKVVARVTNKGELELAWGDKSLVLDVAQVRALREWMEEVYSE